MATTKLLRSTPFTADKIAPNKQHPQFYSKELKRDVGPPSLLYDLAPLPAYPKSTGMPQYQPFEVNPSLSTSSGLFAAPPTVNAGDTLSAGQFVRNSQRAKLSLDTKRNRDCDAKPLGDVPKSVVGDPSVFTNLNAAGEKPEVGADAGQPKTVARVVRSLLSREPGRETAYPEKSLMMQVLRLDELTDNSDPTKRTRRRTDDAIIQRRFPVTWEYFTPANIEYLLTNCKWVPGKTPVFADIRRLMEQTQRSYQRQFQKYASTSRAEPYPIDPWLDHMNTTTLAAIEQLGSSKAMGIKYPENVNDRPITSNRANQYDITHDSTIRITGHRVRGPRDQHSQRGNMSKLGVYLQTQERARAAHTVLLGQAGYDVQRAASSTTNSDMYQDTAASGRPVLRRNATVRPTAIPRLAQNKTSQMYSQTRTDDVQVPPADVVNPRPALRQAMRPQATTKRAPVGGVNSQFGPNVSRQQIREHIQRQMM